MHKLKEHSKQQHTDMFYFLAYINSLSLNMSIVHAPHTHPECLDGKCELDGWTKVTFNPSYICCWVRGVTVTFQTIIHLETILKLTICQLCMPESLQLENIHISNNLAQTTVINTQMAHWIRQQCLNKHTGYLYTVTNWQMLELVTWTWTTVNNKDKSMY